MRGVLWGLGMRIWLRDLLVLFFNVEVVIAFALH